MCVLPFFKQVPFWKKNVLRNFASYYHPILHRTSCCGKDLPLQSIKQLIKKLLFIHFAPILFGVFESIEQYILLVLLHLFVPFELSLNVPAHASFEQWVLLKVVPRQSRVYHTLSQKLSKIYLKNYFQDLFSHKQTCEKLEQYSAYCVSIPFLKLLIHHFYNQTEIYFILMSDHLVYSCDVWGWLGGEISCWSLLNKVYQQTHVNLNGKCVFLQLHDCKTSHHCR